MELKEKEKLIKILAQQQAFGIKKLISIGGSFAVVIPMTWIKYHCVEIDGDNYFKLNVEGDTLILKGINDDDLEGITLKKKEGVA